MNYSNEAMPHISHFNSSEVTLSSFFDMLSDDKHEDNETKVHPSPFRYVDYAEQDDECSLHKVRLYGMKMPFPARLHAALNKIEEDDLSSVVLISGIGSGLLTIRLVPEITDGTVLSLSSLGL